MKVTLNLDNAPTLQSSQEIRDELRKKRVKLLHICRVHNCADLYHQFQSWLSGQPNQRHYEKFVEVLTAEGVITEVEKLGNY